MFKHNKWKLIVSSVVILLPILVGVLFWNKLPEQLATHWGISGEADGWSDRRLAVFGVPVFVLAVHWLCVFVTARDPKNKDQNRKISDLVLWIAPAVSWFAGAAIYTTALGIKHSIEKLPLLLLGLMFVVIGNYLPKCKQNHTIGIKVKWALEDEENWNATHRMGGKLWVVGGLLMMICAFFPDAAIPYLLWILLPILVVIPVVYSYIYYKKQQK